MVLAPNLTSTARLNSAQTARLMAWIDSAWQRDESLRRHWDDNARRYTGPDVPKEKAEDPDNFGGINLAFLHARTLLPTIFAKDPYVKVKPPREEYAYDAPIWEALLNTSIKKAKFKGQVKRAVLDAIICGEGYVKTGWVADKEEPGQSRTGPERPLGVLESSLMTQGFDIQNGALNALQKPTRTPATREMRTRSELGRNPVTWLKYGAPFVQRVRPHDIIVDPLVGDRDTARARFVAIRYVKPLAELRANPEYRIPEQFDRTKLIRGTSFNKGRITYTSPLGRPEPDDVEENSWLPSGVDLAITWEVWAYELIDGAAGEDGAFVLQKRVLTLMEGAEIPIRQPVDWKDIVGRDVDGYPIHRVAFNEVPDRPPMGEFDSWATLNDQINWAMRRGLMNLKRYTRGTAIDVTKLDVASKQRTLGIIRDGEDDWVAEVTGPGAIEPINSANINAPDIYNMLQYLGNMAQLVSGLSEQRKGEAGARTATEAAIIEGASKVKLTEKEDIIDDWCTDIAYGVAAIIKSKATRDYVVRRVGEGGSVEWLSFGPEQIDWMPDLELEFNSARFTNEQQEVQKWQTVLGLLMQFVPLMPQIRVDIVLAHALKSLQVPNVTEILGNIMGANAREEQMAAIIIMLSGVPVEARLGEPHVVMMQVTDEIRNTAGGAVTANPNWQLVEMNYAQHAAMQHQLEQLATASPRPTAGPEAGIAESPLGGLPANEARGERPEGPGPEPNRPRLVGGGAPDEAAPRIPGASNQRAI